MAIPAEVQQFAKILAAETDEGKRARLLAQAKLLASQSAPAEAFEAPIRTLGDYLASPIEVPPVLVQPYMIVRGGLHATIGRAGKGKTVMNLNRLLRWSAGQPMFDGWHDGDGNNVMAPDDPLKILIIENEGAAGLFHRQIGIMLHAEGFMDDASRKLANENILIWGDGGYSDLKFDDQKKRDLVRAGVDKWKPDIVFVEPFRSLWAGEENSSTEMSAVVDALIGIATEFECGAVIAHHQKKGGGEGEGYERMSDARGSSVLEGAVTIMENFDSVKGGEYRELSWSKSRHHKAPNPVRMEWVPDAWWYKWVPISELDETILSAVRENADEPMSIADMHEVTQEPKGKLRERANKLVDEGRLKKMPSVSTAAGSTGLRYRMPQTEESNYGGLSV